MQQPINQQPKDIPAQHAHAQHLRHLKAQTFSVQTVLIGSIVLMAAIALTPPSVFQALETAILSVMP